MNNTMKVAGVVGALLLIVLFVYASLFAWHHPSGNLSPCDTPSVVFSEFKEENNSGIYTTEILEYEKTDCSNAWKNVYIYLLDAEGVAHGNEDYWGNKQFYGGEIIANYEGDNPSNINITSNMANDTNGTKYPVRIINNMSEDPSLNESYNPNWREGGSYDYGLKLSIGDKIIVYGSGSEADGIAKEGWSLRIKYKVTGETLSEIKIA